ncbi:MAG: hypothetical protein NVS3B20_16860 [Polyangiales bacterium]
MLDPTGHRLVIFGGDISVPLCNGVPSRKHVDDTWVLDVGCAAWREVARTGAKPPARARHAMAVDASAKRALLFGGRSRAGESGPYRLFNDVWSFDFASETWTELKTNGTPPVPRANATIVVDAARKQLIVFGGNASTSGTAFTPLGDTFALDLQTLTWREVVAASASPPKRLFHAMAIDDDAHVAYVFGGGDENAFIGPFFQDVWALDLSTLAGESWREVKTSGSKPTGRINHALIFDRVGKRLVAFAGHDDQRLGNQNDVFTLEPSASAPTWKRLPLGDTFNKPARSTCNFPPDFTTIDNFSPERRSSFASGATANGRGFLIYGGKSDCGLVADAWWFNGNQEQWAKVIKLPLGLSCLRFSAVCDGLCQ